jgi:hypothetical protein
MSNGCSGVNEWVVFLTRVASPSYIGTVNNLEQ